MSTMTGKAADEAQILEILESWAGALRAKDADALVAHYAPDVLSYDLAPPLGQRGVDTLRRGFEQWLPTFEGPVGFEIRDLSVTTGDEVAFSTSLNRISGARTSGERTEVWVRATVCFRKTDGRWTVVHEHVSVPFHMDGSYKAAIDLQP